MSDMTELRTALKLNDGDTMHGNSLLLHAAKRISELEATNTDMLAAFDQFLRDEGYSDEEVGRVLGPWING